MSLVTRLISEKYGSDISRPGLGVHLGQLWHLGELAAHLRAQRRWLCRFGTPTRLWRLSRSWSKPAVGPDERRAPEEVPVSPEAVQPPAEQGADGALAATFREVMAGVATPVSVITTLCHGLPHGTTVSAFASLSMDPPMVLVSLDRGSDLLARVQVTKRFGVNVLGVRQADLALAFARKGGTGKFAGIAWENDTGLPRLPGVPGWLACEVSALVDGGDHVIALGTVISAACGDEPPLTYHGRVFGTHAALEGAR